jgi:rare lipoprotein A
MRAFSFASARFRAQAVCGRIPDNSNPAISLAFGMLLAVCIIGTGIESGRAAPVKSLLSVGTTPTPIALFQGALPDTGGDVQIAWLNSYDGRLNSPTDDNISLTDLYAFDDDASPITTASIVPRAGGLFEPNPTLEAAAASGSKLAALVEAPLTLLERLRQYTGDTDGGIVGIASMYNPYADNETETAQTASGEIYDPLAWTAAIQIGLRGQFGGVRYGRLYQPAYVLVESGEKRAIVKINDVGPLRPGRIIDFNERTMRYFDPSLRLGLIKDVRVTLLPGADWITGPVASEGVMLAGGFE